MTVESPDSPALAFTRDHVPFPLTIAAVARGPN